MRRSWLAFVLLVSLALTACGPSQVVVTAELEVEDPETGEMTSNPIADLEVELLPFDRDQILDSLEAAFGEPEPALPDDFLEAQDSIQAAQEEWRAAEAEWATLRDRAQSITEEMEPLARGEAAYVALYREFEDVEERLTRVEREKNRLFERFTELQEGFMQRADSLRLVRDQWADEAFADAFDVFATKIEETGKEIVVDTTGAEGMVTVDVEPGEWWVHARHELPFELLYWNLPVTVARGEPATVFLTRETAEIRPNF
jgi:hypothetical protein